jgi:hypothetical protein
VLPIILGSGVRYLKTYPELAGVPGVGLHLQASRGAAVPVQACTMLFHSVNYHCASQEYLGLVSKFKRQLRSRQQDMLLLILCFMLCACRW